MPPKPTCEKAAGGKSSWIAHGTRECRYHECCPLDWPSRVLGPCYSYNTYIIATTCGISRVRRAEPRRSKGERGRANSEDQPAHGGGSPSVSLLAYRGTYKSSPVSLVVTIGESASDTRLHICFVFPLSLTLPPSLPSLSPRCRYSLLFAPPPPPIPSLSPLLPCCDSLFYPPSCACYSLWRH